MTLPANRAALSSAIELALAEAEGAYREKLRETPGAWIEARGDLNTLRVVGRNIAATAALVLAAKGILPRHARYDTSLRFLVARLTDAIDDQFTVEASAVVLAAAMQAVEG